jgi:hypothetical protein
MRTIKLLLQDALEFKSIVCSDSILDGLATYFSHKNIRMMFVNDGILHSGAISRKVKKNNIEYAVLDSILSIDYFEENKEYKFTKNLTYSITDPMSDSFKNEIPSERLLYNYTYLSELPESYLNKLDDIYDEIYHVIEYLMLRDHAHKTEIYEKNNHADKIRKFLNRELI